MKTTTKNIIKLLFYLYFGMKNKKHEMKSRKNESKKIFGQQK